MDRKISYEVACSFNEIYEVEKKIRASSCKKKDAPLKDFNWYIRSCRLHRISETAILVFLIAKTRGAGYSARVYNVPEDIIEYWKKN